MDQFLKERNVGHLSDLRQDPEFWKYVEQALKEQKISKEREAQDLETYRDKLERDQATYRQIEKHWRDVPGYENGNVAEADHPWHDRISWLSCYTDECTIHLDDKIRRRTFPIHQIPVYLVKDKQGLRRSKSSKN